MIHALFVCLHDSKGMLRVHSFDRKINHFIGFLPLNTHTHAHNVLCLHSCYSLLDFRGKCCLVTELYKWGDLEGCHGRLNLHTMPRLARLLLDISSGMQHLHSQEPPIIHRDIRCANILLHEDVREKERTWDSKLPCL